MQHGNGCKMGVSKANLSCHHIAPARG